MAGDQKAPDYAASFGKYRSQTTEATAALIRSVLRYVPSSPGARMIDIGCGTGRYALPLASATEAQVFATDLSRAMVEQGRDKDNGGAVSWVLGDACRIPFADQSFDVALLFLVLHVLKDSKKGLQEAYRILRSGGHCLILTHSHFQLDRQTLFRLFPEARKLNKRRMLSLAKLKERAREIGFHHLRSEEVVEAATLSREAFLEKVRSRPNTSLRSMSDADFQRRYEALEATVAGQETCTEESFSTLLAARK
jgi:ubiquinone/menaquinone biosynthesis C-methylase UbiE